MPETTLTPWEVGAAHPTRRRRLLIGAAVLFGGITAVFGLPTGREVVTLWVLVLLFAVVGGDPRAWRATVLKDWLPFLLVLFAYDVLRGFADGAIERAHLLPQLRAEELLFGGVPTVWLQEHLYTPAPAFYDYLIVPVYLSHFVVPMAVAVGLWSRSYVRFREYVATFVVLTCGTLLTYALYPAVPPWLASETVDPRTGQTYLPFVERVSSHTLAEAGIPTIHNAVQRGEAYANPVAAIPSLHSAVPMLVVLLAWPYARTLGRSLFLLYLAAMTFTLVYGGEHYVVDVLIGWAYAALAVLAVRAVLRRRRAAVAPAPTPTSAVRS